MQQRFLCWVSFAICALSLAVAQDAKVTPKPMIRRLILTVASLESSVAFYRDLIGLKLETPRYKMGAVVPALYGAPGTEMEAAVLKLPGAEDVVMILIEARSGGRALPKLETTGALRLIFAHTDLPSVRRRLREADVTDLLAEATSETRPILVRDPDGFFVEFQSAEQAAGAKQEPIANLRVAITVQNTDATLSMYREAFACDAQAGSFSAVDGQRLDVPDLTGSEYRRSRCVFPRGHYPVEFLEFRKPEGIPGNQTSSLRESGAVVLEFLVAGSEYERTVAALRANGADFIVPGGQIHEISGRKSVILRTPDGVFVEPRSTGK